MEQWDNEKPRFDFVSHKGYLYVANKYERNKMYYHCYLYKSDKCRATAQVPMNNRSVIKLGRLDHNHPQNPSASIICRFKNKLKYRMGATDAPVDAVYKQLAEEDPEGALYVPKTKNLFVAMGHWRYRHR